MKQHVVLNSAALLAIVTALWSVPIAARAEEPIFSATGPEPNFRGCKLYVDRNYGSPDFGAGVTPDRPWHELPKKFSSIACAQGCKVTVYENAEFGGASVTWGGFIPYVGTNWDDRISSAKVACAPLPSELPVDASMENNVNRPGSDYTDFETPTPRACQHACNVQSDRCHAWSFVRPRTPGAFGRCYLKSSVPDAVDDTCCVSGHYRRLGKASGKSEPSPSPQAPPDPSTPQSTELTTGTFDTSFGTLTLGTKRGAYTVKNGRVIVENRHDNIVEGRWEQSSAARQCPDGRYWGKFVFAFDANGFTGFYGYCDEPPTAGAWNGKRM